nr:MAG TPA: hypothetical protein [Caudoviricetes sp.]
MENKKTIFDIILSIKEIVIFCRFFGFSVVVYIRDFIVCEIKINRGQVIL